MENCSKKSASAEAGLPDDIVVEILSRVPAISVCRFKCVSKAWRDLIAHPDHRKKLRQAMQGLFFMTPKKVVDHFSSSFMDLTAGSMSVDIDPSFSFLMEQPENHHLALRDSCNGLILFQRHEEKPPYNTLGYIVCNPTTKQWRAVPAYGSPKGLNHTYLAFDPAVSSHFNLVQFQKTVVNLEWMSMHAYSSETGTWSHNQTEEEEEQGQLEGWKILVHLPINHCAFVNGFLHFVVWDSYKQQMVVVVDVQGKARRMFKLPDMVDVNRRCFCIYLGQSQGFLHCITKQSISEERYELSIWVQDYDAKEWLLKDTVSSVQLFGEKCPRSYMLDCDVADMHQDCNVVFFFSPCEHKFIAYDMDHKKVSFFATSKCISKLKVGRYVPLFSESPAPLK